MPLIYSLQHGVKVQVFRPATVGDEVSMKILWDPARGFEDISNWPAWEIVNTYALDATPVPFDRYIEDAGKSSMA